MRFEEYTLDAGTTVGTAHTAGASIDIRDLVNVLVVITPNDVGNFLKIQVSQTGDAADWLDFGDAAEGETLPRYIEDEWAFLRIVPTAHVAGTPEAYLTGYNVRTH